MVRTDKSGIIHAYAQCSDCEWNSAIKINENNRMQKLRNRIYSHVIKTKHRVTLETGNSTKYYYTLTTN